MDNLSYETLAQKKIDNGQAYARYLVSSAQLACEELNVVAVPCQIAKICDLAHEASNMVESEYVDAEAAVREVLLFIKRGVIDIEHLEKVPDEVMEDLAELIADKDYLHIG
jgi:hypothetical protein